MADIPTHNLVFQFPDDGGGDPARGGGDGGMSAVLDVLRHIQVNVGAINGNVRAILETLRTISSRSRSIGSSPSSGGRRDGVSVERVFHVDPRKALGPYMPRDGVMVSSADMPFSPLRWQAEQMRAVGRMRRTPLLPMSEAEAQQRAARANRPRPVRPIPIGIEEEPPIAPVPARASRMQAFTSSIYSSVSLGRILATVQLIGMTARSIRDSVAFLPRMARENRSMLGGYSISFAQMNTEARLSELMDRLKIAHNAGMNVAYRSFTDKEMIATEATRNMRMFGSKAAAGFGGILMDRLSDIGMILSGDMDTAKLGMYGLVTRSGLFGLHYPVLKYLFPDMFTAADIAYNGYRNQLLRQSVSTFNQQFATDIHAMTGGRFRMDVAYPAGSNETNWWDRRP